MKNLSFNKSATFNDFYVNMMKYFNTTLSEMNTFKDMIKTKDKEIREQYLIICKDFINTKDYFQKFYLSVSENTVSNFNIER
jgi:hypothetical protein